MSESYGTILRQERKKRGYTLEQMAEMLGVSPISVGTWERGKVYPNEYMRWNIEDKLGIVLPEKERS